VKKVMNLELPYKEGEILDLLTLLTSQEEYKSTTRR
jgi:hypothetical protein